MILNNNLNFLSSNILQELKKVNYSKIEYKLSKNSFKIPVVNNSVLHSTYDPLGESSRLNFSDNGELLCIAIGFGAGYHLINYHDRNRSILVIPLDMNLLLNIISDIDLTRYFDPAKLKFITEEEIILNFDFTRYKGFFIIVHPVLQKFHNAKVISIINRLKEKLNPAILENNTLRKFGRIWHKNILKNIKYYFEGKYDFSTLHIDKPVLIAGAGPSLDQNMEEIKKERAGLYIASTDTALKIFLKHSIVPDSVFSFDAQNYSHLHFTDNPNIRFFSDFTSPLKLSSAKQTMIFSNHPFYRIFLESGFSPAMISSYSRNIGGAVAEFFINNFANLPLISAGIDFAFFDYNSYSRGTFLSEYYNINSCYHVTSETLNSCLFYKEQFVKYSGKWKTTGFMSNYSANSTDKISTISSSPFNLSKKNGLNEFIEKNKKMITQTFEFKAPCIKPLEFLSNIINHINKDISPLYPFLISSGLHPSKENLDIIINDLERFFRTI